MPLSNVYKNFQAARAANEQGEMADLQKAQAVQGMLAQMQARQREAAFAAEAQALGPDATLEQHEAVAARHVSDPAKRLDLLSKTRDRKDATEARREAAAAKLEMQGRFAELQHDIRMRAAATAEARAAETARHNGVIEGLRQQIAGLKQPPQGQILQTDAGPMNVRDGRATPVLGPDNQPLGPRNVEKALPSSAAQKLFENQQNLRRAETALALMEGKNVGSAMGDADATGWKGFLPDAWLQRFDPAGTDARAALADLGSLVIHERSGAAVSASEFPRLQPFIPKINDDPETVKKKLKRFAQIYRDVSTETTNFYRESGYKVPELSSGATPAAAPAPAAAKFEEGKTYVDAKGNRAKFQGGKFVPVP